MFCLFLSSLGILLLEKSNDGSFSSIKFTYTLANNSQSTTALCLSLFELSILNFLHKASKLI